MYQAGIPSMVLRFINAQYNLSMLYPTHHTGYDTMELYERHLDPEFKFLETCRQSYQMKSVEKKAKNLEIAQKCFKMSKYVKNSQKIFLVIWSQK